MGDTMSRMFSRQIIEQILDEVGWAGDPPELRNAPRRPAPPANTAPPPPPAAQQPSQVIINIYCTPSPA